MHTSSSYSFEEQDLVVRISEFLTAQAPGSSRVPAAENRCQRCEALVTDCWRTEQEQLLNYLELYCIGHIFVSFSTAVDEKITEARGFAVRVPGKILLAMFSSALLNTECSWLLCSCSVHMWNLPSAFFFSPDVISAAQLPTPVFVRSKNYTRQNEKTKVTTHRQIMAVAFGILCPAGTFSC